MRRHIIWSLVAVLMIAGGVKAQAPPWYAAPINLVPATDQCTVLDGIQSSSWLGSQPGAIYPVSYYESTYNQLNGFSLEASWKAPGQPNGTSAAWDMTIPVPAGTNMSNYDTFNIAFYPQTGATSDVTLKVYLEDTGQNWWLLKLNPSQSNPWVVPFTSIVPGPPHYNWLILTSTLSAMSAGSYGAGFGPTNGLYVSQPAGHWNNINKVVIEMDATSASPNAVLDIDDVSFTNSTNPNLSCQLLNTNVDGISANGMNNAINPILGNGLVFLPGVAEPAVGGITNAAKWANLFPGHFATTTDNPSTAQNVESAGYPISEYSQYANNYLKYLTKTSSWDFCYNLQSPAYPFTFNSIPMTYASPVSFPGLFGSQYVNASSIGPVLQCQSDGSPWATAAGQTRISALSQMGIGNWIMADDVLPYTAGGDAPWSPLYPFGQFGYSSDNKSAYQVDLAGFDSGLVQRGASGPSVLYFPQYFQSYTGCTLSSVINPSNYSTWSPPTDAIAQNNPAWSVFEYLRAYEWAKLTDRTGRYQQDYGGQGVSPMPNPETWFGSPDYYSSIASGGVSNFLLEEFGNPEGALEAGYNALPALREQAELGAQGSMSTQGSGDIWGTSDLFHYTYRKITGNATIIARVKSIANSSIYAKAGVMFRNSLSPTDLFAEVVATPGSGLDFMFRPAVGYGPSNDGGPNVAPPYWVKLQRVGNIFSGYYSADGVNWTYINQNPSNQCQMGSTIYVGIPVASSTTTDTTAVLDNISIADSSGSQTGGLFTTSFEPSDPELQVWNTVISSQNVASNPLLYPSTALAHTGASSIYYGGASNNLGADCYCEYQEEMLANPIPISANTTLSYWINPQQDNGRHVAIDLIFTNGDHLIYHDNVRDQRGYRIHPGDAHGGQIPLNAWTQIKSDIGHWLPAGLVVQEIAVIFEHAYSTGTYSGFIDDISLTTPLCPMADSDIGAVTTGGSTTNNIPGKLSLDMETGTNGHNDPYWSPQIAYLTTYSLTAAGNADDLDNDFMDESTFDWQSGNFTYSGSNAYGNGSDPNADPAQFGTNGLAINGQNARFNDCVSKGKGFLEAYSEPARRPIAQILNISTRPPARAVNGTTQSVSQPCSFGLPLSRAHLVFDQRDSMCMSSIASRYNMIAYAPLVPSVGDISFLNGWVQASAGRVFVTNTFVPTTDASTNAGFVAAPIFGPNTTSLTGFGTISQIGYLGGSQQFTIQSISPDWAAATGWHDGSSITLPDQTYFTQCSSGTPAIVIHGTAGTFTILTQQTFTVGGVSNASRTVYLNMTSVNMLNANLLQAETTIMKGAASFASVAPTALVTDSTDPTNTSTIVQAYNVPGGMSVAVWDASTFENTAVWQSYPIPTPYSPITNASTGHSKQVQLIVPSSGVQYEIFDFDNGGAPTNVTSAMVNGYAVVNLPAMTTLGDLYYVGQTTNNPDFTGSGGPLATAEATRTALGGYKFTN